jgi:hypothetical protein
MIVKVGVVVEALDGVTVKVEWDEAAMACRNMKATGRLGRHCDA